MLFKYFICLIVSMFLMLAHTSNAKCLPHHHDLKDHESIPKFLEAMDRKLGHEKFKETWKSFNNGSSDHQDAFLMEDLSVEELAQLSKDFDKLAVALSLDSELMELYADFERNLSTKSFTEMDNKLNQKWWTRIKKFLFRKLHKLADMNSSRT